MAKENEEKCDHAWGSEYWIDEGDHYLYSEYELHLAIIAQEASSEWRTGINSGYVTVFEYCPDCGEQLVK